MLIIMSWLYIISMGCIWINQFIIHKPETAKIGPGIAASKPNHHWSSYRGLWGMSHPYAAAFLKVPAAKGMLEKGLSPKIIYCLLEVSLSPNLAWPSNSCFGNVAPTGLNMQFFSGWYYCFAWIQNGFRSFSASWHKRPSQVLWVVMVSLQNCICPTFKTCHHAVTCRLWFCLRCWLNSIGFADRSSIFLRWPHEPWPFFWPGALSSKRWYLCHIYIQYI